MTQVIAQPQDWYVTFLPFTVDCQVHSIPMGQMVHSPRTTEPSLNSDDGRSSPAVSGPWDSWQRKDAESAGLCT